MAFPFPRTFKWTRNGLSAGNTSDRIVFGYPAVTFHNISRNDIGTFVLFAENFRFDDPQQIIGNDTGSVTLDVLCMLLLCKDVHYCNSSQCISCSLF